MKTRDFLKLLVMMLAVPFVFAACSDDDGPVPSPTPEPTPVPDPEPDYSVPTDQQGLYIFNTGNEGSSINGSINYVNFSKDDNHAKVFETVNGRSLGSTVQNATIWHNKMYIAVFGSNTIEVVDKLTVESIKQIKLGEDDGKPRFVIADDNYVYASMQTGFVSRINPETDEVDKTIAVGPNPEEMAIMNGYLYVVNSDGLNWNGGYANGKSVSKIDLSTFEEVKKIGVGLNPTRIAADDTYVYVVAMGDYGATPSSIWKIDANDNTTDTGVSATWIAVNAGLLYVINSVYNADYTTTNNYTVYNVEDMSVKTENFLQDDLVESPAGIVIDPVGGNIFISSYYLENGFPAYSTIGHVIQYDFDGVSSWDFSAGVGPCYMLVLR